MIPVKQRKETQFFIIERNSPSIKPLNLFYRYKGLVFNLLVFKISRMNYFTNLYKTAKTVISGVQQWKAFANRVKPHQSFKHSAPPEPFDYSSMTGWAPVSRSRARCRTPVTTASSRSNSVRGAPDTTTRARSTTTLPTGCRSRRSLALRSRCRPVLRCTRPARWGWIAQR